MVLLVQNTVLGLRFALEINHLVFCYIINFTFHRDNIKIKSIVFYSGWHEDNDNMDKDNFGIVWFSLFLKFQVSLLLTHPHPHPPHTLIIR